MLLLVGQCPAAPILKFEIREAETGELTAARFSLLVNGVPFAAERVNRNAFRFLSVHESKQQVFVATYARGTGRVEVNLPAAASTVELRIAKGFEYLPVQKTFSSDQLDVSHTVRLQRWTNLPARGWVAADAHLHYDRFSSRANQLWFEMMKGDDLASAHFMFLKGGKVPGEWARQYGYGRKGEAVDGQRLITAGMEYRDSAQGHINLLGMPEIVQPIMAGTGGLPNYPTLKSVLERARNLGGLSGVAHGGSLGGKATVILDAILGAPDFIEIGNSHLFSLENWYRLMNCGFIYPPAAGTDLPNYPERDWWQPFLGGMRMYVKVGDERGFNSFKESVRAGRVFVSSGPIISLSVNGQEPGSRIRLPAKGGEVLVEAELASPRALHAFQLIQNGGSISTRVVATTNGIVSRWKIRQRLQITNSCWLAVRGEGIPIISLKRAMLPPVPWHRSDEAAHTAAVTIQVGDQPIWSGADAHHLMAGLELQKKFYATQARFEKPEHRAEMQDLFESAIERLRRRKAE